MVSIPVDRPGCNWIDEYMKQYIIKRLLLIIFTLFGLITITFIENFFITIKGGMPVYVTDAAENPEIDDIIHEEAAADGAHNPEKGA